jgi:hypothetical protein
VTRAYRHLFVAALAVALALTVLARVPRRAAPPAPVAAAPVAVRELALEVRDGTVEPAHVRVRKGERVRLTVHNAGTAPAHLALTGYAGRVASGAIAAGASWTVTFDADLPGEDFAWMVDERPAGRFDVTGSHLVEGHR